MFFSWFLIFETTFGWYFGISVSLFCDILGLGTCLASLGIFGRPKWPNLECYTFQGEHFWLHFGSLFRWKSDLFLCCFLYAFLDWFFIDFYWFWKPFWELFGSIFDKFLKTAILWKIAPRLSESMIFKVLEDLETLLLGYFFGYGFWMASGTDF